MADFDTTLNSILGDPNAMNQIMALAQSISGGLGGGGESASTEEVEEVSGQGEEEASREEWSLPAPPQTESRDTALLQALRPFLKEERRAQVDRALEMVGMIRLLRTTFGTVQRSE